MKNLIQRLIGGISILVILLVFSFLNQGIFTLFVIGLLLLALYEFFLDFGHHYPAISYGLGALGTVPLVFFAYLSRENLMLSWLSLFVITIFTIDILKSEMKIERTSFYIFSAVYLGVGFSHLVLLQPTPLLFLVYLIAWGTDTFAYIGGSLFGKRPLSPVISPKKSVEGSLSGILGAVFLSILYVWARAISIPWLLLIPFAILGSLLSQLGDLAASSIKRRMGVKDYGFIIAGHGGVMDRFDSMLFVAPYAYFVFTWLYSISL